METFLVLLLSVGTFASRIPTNDWRIVGGQTAAEGQFPYQIALRRYGSHSCGGSIINPTTILNAAHCVDGASESSLTVVAGTNQVDGQGISYNVKSISQHSGYQPSLIINDISLIHLGSSIQYNDRVQPIALGTSNVEAGIDLVLSGWGTTSFPGSAPKNLQFINLVSISNQDCAEKHPFGVITAGQICTFTKSGEGACHGDSGGPLVQGGEQVGIVSWGHPCADGYPDVFTRVSSYNDWINSNLE